jgi:hypothetical protein
LKHNNKGDNDMELPELKKGDTLTLEVTKALVKQEPGTTKYSFGLLALRDRIEKQFAERGTDVTVIISGSQLHICTDAEASDYNLKAVKSHVGRVVYREAKLRGVAIHELTQAEKQAHARRLVYAAMLSDGVKKGMKAARAMVNQTVDATAE